MRTNMLDLLLLFPPLLLLSAAATKDCSRVCGNVNIPFPFGIEPGCFLTNFNISCNETEDGTYKPYLSTSNIEVVNISVTSNQLRVYNYVGHACYNSSGNLSSYANSFIGLYNLPYRFSDTLNKFTAIGCNTLAYISGTDGDKKYMSGCVSSCEKSSLVDRAPCTGEGCCQASVPKELIYYTVNFDFNFNQTEKSIWEFNPCSYAFMVDDSWYKFRSSDVYNYTPEVVPVVLDWAVRNKTCEQAKLDKASYACVNENSECINSTNGPGYTCNCFTGYRGIPYKDQNGENTCLNIDECENAEDYSCYGDCKDLPGSFNCSCPSGMSGNPNIKGNCSCPFGMHDDKQGDCQPDSDRKLSLLGKMLIAGASGFLTIVIIYLAYEKAKLIRAKQECFEQNGGLLFQEQINAHHGVRFKLFTIKEMQRATNNFGEDQVRGRGGQGIVYEGILDDKRRAAVKRSIIIDAKKKKEFAKEMYILSLINHRNVVKILGCCLEVKVPILVYEFVSRGTLYQCIQNKSQNMPFGFRLKVAIDSASALAYLHSYASPSIVHGDVKSSNILLDDENMAKVSDFGASLLPLKDIIETGVTGTYGYIDPESLQTGQLTEKSDVYSFAVVILELLTRKKAVYSEGPAEKRSLAQTFNKKGLADILDEEIKYEVTEEKIKEFTKLLRACLRDRGAERPIMTEVVAWLQRMGKLNHNLLSEEISLINIELGHGESSQHTIYTSQYYSSGNQAALELDYDLTR